MLRHTGTKRTPRHNLRLATLLGLTAGFVNAAGFLGFSVLTTNVTGHVALFAESVAFQDWSTARVVALWMFLFLAGAFCSSLITTLIDKNRRFSYGLPILIEMAILIFTAIYGHKYDTTIVSKEFFAGGLLFAMGLQNSLVSVISGSVVRTTHLTGTFTDLGIELAQLISRKVKARSVLQSKILLRLFIIGSFMAGAILGAYIFYHWEFHSFFIPVFILFFTLLYDLFRINAQRYYHTAAKAVKYSLTRKRLR
ncbi:YoaK family protein [Pedobacter immunditicola]|uniref:YoaK family protein n=1 Tax=Pedobacter immunditicola TaxID=3133440 RepID=UPI003097E0EF